MKYVAGIVLLLLSMMIENTAWATDHSALDFYALKDVNRTQGNATQVRMLSDAQLGKVEGSAWFPWADDHLRQAQVREIVFQYFVANLLTDLVGRTRTTPIASATFEQKKASPTLEQNNFLIQLNIAIGEHITQVNKAIQQNFLIINQRVR